LWYHCVLYGANRAREESLREAQRKADEEEQQRQQLEAAAAEQAAATERKLQQSLTQKRMNLSSEPQSGAPGAVMVMIRLPDGSRKGRRFLNTDALQQVFDFVDVECGVAGCAEGVVKPGQYRLVTQFPRKVYTEGVQGSLADAGITTDTALFLELL
jgi:ATPase subunit of ABC transporter with duplicated ATPase domains